MGETGDALFEATHSSLLVDYLGVPGRVVGRVAAPPALPERHPARGWSWLTAEGGFLGWPFRPAGAFGEHRLDGAPLFATVVPDAEIEPLLGALGGAWRRLRSVRDVGGAPVASIWRGEDGSTVLPFDPDEAVQSCWSERYRSAPGARLGSVARAKARQLYYRLRPLLPRAAQIALRRLYAPVQTRQRFPRWPVEPALHDLLDFLLAAAATAAGQPVPYLAPWPGRHRWALVLTHDVELAIGCANVGPLRAIEEELGYRSSWNFVPRRYDTPSELVRDLSAAGFEVGVHGLYHDGRDLESAATLSRRLPAIREAAERWGAVGFRSPALNRRWDLMPRLGFDYDSSYPDSDPHGPQGGGSCAWWPYFNEELVELPVTMPQDHTIFEILGQTGDELWCQKAALLRDRGGMANLIVHPDYMLAPERLQVYRRFLAGLADDATAWRALPRDVAAWWRRRAASRLASRHGEWEVVGPASVDGTVALARPSVATGIAA